LWVVFGEGGVGGGEDISVMEEFLKISMTSKF